MTTANRETLSRAANLVRPALATKEYIPVYTHIHFSGGRATACNDVSALSVACANPVECCVPGELLIRALSGFGGAEVSMQMKDSTLLLKSGRSNVKLPTLPASDFLFDLPNPNEGEAVSLGRSVVKAIERCLLSVGTDNAHPAQMGVTLESEKGLAVLYSTDNYTISRCSTEAKLKLPGDAPIILPRFFCEQLIGLAKAYPEATMDLVMYPGALVVEFVDVREGPDAPAAAILFTKTPVDLEPMDFPRIVNKHVDLADIKKTLAVIPDAFDGALNRALLVLGSELQKKTKITAGDGLLIMSSRSSLGESDDSMKFDMDDHNFEVDPVLLTRGAKACALMGFTNRVTIMADTECNFIHIIAHRA